MYVHVCTCICVYIEARSTRNPATHTTPTSHAAHHPPTHLQLATIILDQPTIRKKQLLPHHRHMQHPSLLLPKPQRHTGRLCHLAHHRCVWSLTHQFGGWGTCLGYHTSKGTQHRLTQLCSLLHADDHVEQRRGDLPDPPGTLCMLCCVVDGVGECEGVDEVPSVYGVLVGDASGVEVGKGGACGGVFGECSCLCCLCVCGGVFSKWVGVCLWG